MAENFKRILRFAVNDFSRNKGLSVAAVFILTVTILMLTGLVFFQGAVSHLTNQVKEKIDITAYFKETVSEEEVLLIKDEISKMSPDIRKIEYVSKEQALAFFNERHQGDAVLARALEEVGSNPFLPSLNIITNGDPMQYAEISNILETAEFSQLVEKVDFSQKRATIEKVYSITRNINIFGLIFSAILIIIAILVVFNTIRLGIENSKEEIATMRVVGASNSFIKGPFIIQGTMYGVVAFLICLVLSLLFSLIFSSKIAVLLPGFNLLSYFLTNLWIFVLIQLCFGIGVGVVSALIVVKKYLEI